MARYGISADLGGTVSPVIFDVEFFNVEMMYQAGIFIIMDPGYYRLTIQCYHGQKRDILSYARMDVDIDSIPVLGTFCSYADNGSASGIFYLDVMDTIFVEKADERLSSGANWNNFMIEKI